VASAGEGGDLGVLRLCVHLLVAMGYGGSLKDASQAIGRSGDGGIDGIIKEDRLGLDVIHVQAKRWDGRTVGRPHVPAFAGSLDGVRAKGDIHHDVQFLRRRPRLRRPDRQAHHPDRRRGAGIP